MELIRSFGSKERHGIGRYGGHYQEILDQISRFIEYIASTLQTGSDNHITENWEYFDTFVGQKTEECVEFMSFFAWNKKQKHYGCQRPKSITDPARETSDVFVIILPSKAKFCTVPFVVDVWWLLVALQGRMTLSIHIFT